MSTPTSDLPRAAAVGRLSFDDDGAALTFTSQRPAHCHLHLPSADDQYESPPAVLPPAHHPGRTRSPFPRPWDHVWHKGLSWALPNVGRHNFWGGAITRAPPSTPTWTTTAPATHGPSRGSTSPALITASESLTGPRR